MRSVRFRLVSAFAALAVLIAAAVSACNETDIKPPVIDGELAMRYAQGNFELGPRAFRTEGAKRSAEWIAVQARPMCQARSPVAAATPRTAESSLGHSWRTERNRRREVMVAISSSG